MFKVTPQFVDYTSKGLTIIDFTLNVATSQLSYIILYQNIQEIHEFNDNTDYFKLELSLPLEKDIKILWLVDNTLIYEQKIYLRKNIKTIFILDNKDKVFTDIYENIKKGDIVLHLGDKLPYKTILENQKLFSDNLNLYSYGIDYNKPLFCNNKINDISIISVDDTNYKLENIKNYINFSFSETIIICLNNYDFNNKNSFLSILNGNKTTEEIRSTFYSLLSQNDKQIFIVTVAKQGLVGKITIDNFSIGVFLLERDIKKSLFKKKNKTKLIMNPDIKYMRWKEDLKIKPSSFLKLNLENKEEISLTVYN